MEKVKFLVEYQDDFQRKHITLANSLSEVRYLQDRFLNKVRYEPLEQKKHKIINPY